MERYVSLTEISDSTSRGQPRGDGGGADWDMVRPSTQVERRQDRPWTRRAERAQADAALVEAACGRLAQVAGPRPVGAGRCSALDGREPLAAACSLVGQA